MKNTIKKLTVGAMLLAFAFTTPVTSLLAVAADDNLVAYNTDYMPEIRGTQASTVSLESNSGITSKNLPISLSLRDSDVKQVLRMFADKAGMNIIFKGDVSGNVTMDLVNVPLNSAFNMVLTATDLSYSVIDNTLVITSGEAGVSVAKQEMAVIPVKYINAGEVANFLNANIYGMNKPGLSNAKIASSNPATNEVVIFGSDNDVVIAKKVINQFDKKPVVTSFSVNHSTPKQMADMICQMLLPNTGDVAGGTSTGGAAGVATGGASSSSSSSSSGSSSGTSDTITLGEGTIACTAKSSSSSSEGASSIALGGITVAYYTQLGTVNLIGGSSQQIEMIKEFIAENDKSQPQAYIEFSLIELNDEGSRIFDNQWTLVTKHLKLDFNGDDGTSVSPMRVLGHGYNPVYAALDGSSKDTLLYTLNLLMKNKKARSVSNPRLVATNGQESTIDMTQDYIKTIKTEMSNTGGTSLYPIVTRTVETSDDLGIKISVTPFISPDGYVYMNLKPEFATVAGREYAQSVYGYQDLLATLLKKNNLDLKNVRVKDGDTLILAGMVSETEQKTVSKVPFLGDIPGLGTFFRSTNNTKTKSELVILITPKIITDDKNPASSVETAL